MTIEGAIVELQSWIDSEEIPFWAKPSLKKIKETVEDEREEHLWIPVTERLPEEYASYYTTIQYKGSKARDVAVLCYDPEDKVWLELWGLGCDVVAWMPLPKEWEGGD